MYMYCSICQVLRLCQDVWAEGCENLFHIFLCDLVNQSPYGHDHWVRHIAIQIKLKSVNVCIYRNFANCVCVLVGVWLDTPEEIAGLHLNSILMRNFKLWI